MHAVPECWWWRSLSDGFQLGISGMEPLGVNVVTQVLHTFLQEPTFDPLPGLPARRGGHPAHREELRPGREDSPTLEVVTETNVLPPLQATKKEIEEWQSQDMSHWLVFGSLFAHETWRQRGCISTARMALSTGTDIHKAGRLTTSVLRNSWFSQYNVGHWD